MGSWWRWYLGFGLVAVFTGVLLPVLPRQGLYALTGASAAVAIVVGIRRNRPHRARAWWLFCGGVTCSIGAVLLWAAEYAHSGQVGFPDQQL